MQSPIESLSPELLWRNFAAISKIPRETFHEDLIIRYLADLAESRGLPYKIDSAGNLVIRVKPSPGHENAPTLVLQSHVDMVCVKDDNVDHDFRKDPINLIIEGGWIHADHTTLGADNGIGVAVSLAILDEPSLIHPPMELLFTVEEEVGLGGAYNLGDNMLTGKIMINMDAGEYNKPCIGSAGGCDSLVTINLKRENFRGLHAVLKVDSLKGGHSGDVYYQTANAISLAAHILHSLDLDYRIISINGGTRRNAIPSSVDVEFAFSSDQQKNFESHVETKREFFRGMFSSNEPDLNVSLEIFANESVQAISSSDSKHLARFLLTLPTGLYGINPDLYELPHESSNLAIIKTEHDRIQIKNLSRGNSPYALLEMRDRLRSACELAGYEIEFQSSYPPWEIKWESRLLEIAKESCRELFDEEPVPMATHGGLEVAIIAEKYKISDIVCIGPLIKGAHSPSERVSIESARNFYSVLRNLVVKIAREY